MRTRMRTRRSRNRSRKASMRTRASCTPTWVRSSALAWRSPPRSLRRQQRRPTGGGGPVWRTTRRRRRTRRRTGPGPLPAVAAAGSSRLILLPRRQPRRPRGGAPPPPQAHPLRPSAAEAPPPSCVRMTEKTGARRSPHSIFSCLSVHSSQLGMEHPKLSTSDSGWPSILLPPPPPQRCTAWNDLVECHESKMNALPLQPGVPILFSLECKSLPGCTAAPRPPPSPPCTSSGRADAQPVRGGGW